MGELEELRLAYAECSKQRNELLNKLKSQPKREWVGIKIDEIPSLWGNADADLWLFAQAIEAKLKEHNQ
jgi:hypothetical protein